MARLSPRMLTLGAVIAVAVCALFAGYFFFAPGSDRPISELGDVFYSEPGDWLDFYVMQAPEGLGWVRLPKRDRSPLFKSDADPANRGFVRPEICGECHADYWNGHRETAHYRTSKEATAETVLGSFAENRRHLDTRDPHLSFEMVARHDGLYQRLVVKKNGRTYEHAARFDIVIGSGNHGQSYLYWLEDQLYQLPISYFSESDRWINSPGIYRDGTADFARDIGARCLDCHATYFAATLQSRGRYDRKNYILGVTCVRCHGPGWAHVQYHRTHPDDKSPRYIVHPGTLTRERANEVCAQCHSGGDVLLAPPFTYQPGDPLEAYVRQDEAVEDAANDDPHAANQLARLMRSRCYQASDNLTCTTCHDPHRQERGNLKSFAERCAKCHQLSDCKLPGGLNTKLQDHCIECHMPSRRDVEGAMQTPQGAQLPLLRDHYIKVWPGLADKVSAKLSGVTP